MDGQDLHGSIGCGFGCLLEAASVFTCDVEPFEECGEVWCFLGFVECHDDVHERVDVPACTRFLSVRTGEQFDVEA